MLRDFRETAEFRAVEAFYEAMFAPGTGHVHSVDDFAPHPDGVHALVTGVAFQGSLVEGPSRRIYRVDLASGGLEDLYGCSGRLPRPSPDSSLLACILRRDGEAEALHIAQYDGQASVDHQIDGLIEQLEWSADSAYLLMVVAGAGADLAGHQGGYALKTEAAGPSWLPEVQAEDNSSLWRTLWVLDVATGAARCVSQVGTNVWEATWIGPGKVAAICSDDHGEGSWYTATLRLIHIDKGGETLLYRPVDQIGLPAGSPDGRHVAFVEAVCSDRGIVCGTLKITDLEGAISTLDTGGVEITSAAWRDPLRIQCAGQKAFDTVVGDISLDSGNLVPSWTSRELTCGNWYPSSRPLRHGRALISVEAYGQAPALAIVGDGDLSVVRSFEAPGAAEAMRDCGRVEPAVWVASDGLEIHGWMVRPDVGEGPFPLVLDIHGGPVWANRNRWMGRARTTPLLVRQGCAVLYANPRGSSTRGQTFAGMVRGDMGGADTGDFISAIDHFVGTGFADVGRLACTGTSYGGFMSSWLVTQETRFAAAAPISPVTNWFSQHRTSQIPHFDLEFLDGSVSRGDGLFFTRSPVMYADHVETPCLIMAGALDKNTPPTQALEFHQALREAGVESVLVVYPDDGHSLRGYPAYFDSAARILSWFGAKLGLAAAP